MRTIRSLFETQSIQYFEGNHWTTDAIYRETFSKIEKYSSEGIITVDMELSALTAVAKFRSCLLAAILLVTDVLSINHTWEGVRSKKFEEGRNTIARIVPQLFIDLV